jgi:hypothetical protein
MKARRVKFAPGFERTLRNLSIEEQEHAIKAIRQFIDGTAENSLRPEKKKGLKGIRAFRVTDRIRAFYIQKRDGEGTYNELFLVGQHNEYRTIKRKKPSARQRQK